MEMSSTSMIVVRFLSMEIYGSTMLVVSLALYCL